MVFDERLRYDDQILSEGGSYMNKSLDIISEEPFL